MQHRAGGGPFDHTGIQAVRQREKGCELLPDRRKFTQSKPDFGRKLMRHERDLHCRVSTGQEVPDHPNQPGQRVY